jgi:hypothetical protein
MATKKVNGVTYQIPPGTEHVWTPPEDVVVTPPRDEVDVADAIHGLRVQGLVRNQDQQKVEELSDGLGLLWTNFKAGKSSKDQLTNQLSAFRNNNLVNVEGIDDITVQIFETVIIKILMESNL